jgi:hypothetical protein
VSASFTQAGYEDVYRGHVSMLQELRNQHPNQCHRIMSALFDTVTSVFFVIEQGSSIELDF